MSCADCFRGHIHDGAPKGRVERLYGRDTYVTEPPEGIEPKGIVVILSDGCGWTFVNTRLLADQFASDGPFVVYLPDFLGGIVMTSEPQDDANWAHTIPSLTSDLLLNLAHAVPTWVIVRSPRHPPHPSGRYQLTARRAPWPAWWQREECWGGCGSR